MTQQTFRVSQNAHVQIRSCHNRVGVVGWDDAQTVRVDDTARQEGDTVFVENIGKVNLRVPRAASVTISDCEADVRVDDLTGRVELTDIGGDVALRGLKGETLVRDVEGDFVAKEVATLKCEGTLGDDVALRAVQHFEADKIKGDVSLSDVGAVVIRELKGDLATHGACGALTLGNADGDLNVRGIKGSLAITHLEGDLIAAGVHGAVDAQDVEGDAVISLAAVADVMLRADGDVVLNLPVDANAEIELDAPHGDVRARVPGVQVVDGDESHLRGTIGSGGAKVQAESMHGDVIARAGVPHPREHAHHFRMHFAGIGPQIAEEVTQSVAESLAECGCMPRREGHEHRGKHRGWRFVRHWRARDFEPQPESAKERSPRGPVPGSPERQAILDAIARGELSVDDAIRKLAGE